MRPLISTLVLIAACGGEPAPADHAGHEKADHDHAKGGQDHDHAKADPAHAGHDMAAHAGGSDHMAKMAATRDGLRASLGPAYDAPVPGLDAADPNRGKLVYETHCASCHGPGGKGDGEAGKGLNPTPGDFTDAFHARYYSDAGRVEIVKKGAQDTAMAGFEGVLTGEQILDVYAYVRGMREGVR
jgi:mono/diheme cytochrome c family protein